MNFLKATLKFVISLGGSNRGRGFPGRTLFPHNAAASPQVNREATSVACGTGRIGLALEFVPGPGNAIFAIWRQIRPGWLSLGDRGELDPRSRAPPLPGCGYLGGEPRARPDLSARPRPRRGVQNAQPFAAHARAPPQPRQVIRACAPRMPDVARGSGAASPPASPPACPPSPGPGGGGVSPAYSRPQQPALGPSPRRTLSPIP